MRAIQLNNPDKVFFTSDPHIGHDNIINYCKRPFASVAEMDATIIKNWNEKVPKDGITFILGDMCFGNRPMYKHFLSSTNGIKYFIPGNHDKDDNIPLELLAAPPQYIIKINVMDPHKQGSSQFIILCHYPLLAWEGNFRGYWQLFGHVHTCPRSKTLDASRVEALILPTQYDVGMDNNNYYPISYHEVDDIITKQKLNTPNVQN